MSILVRDAIETCDAGIIAADRAQSTPELSAYAADYQRHATDWRTVKAALLAQLPVTSVYPGGRTAEIAALMRAYKAHQVTPREFSARLRWLITTAMITIVLDRL